MRPPTESRQHAKTAPVRREDESTVRVELMTPVALAVREPGGVRKSRGAASEWSFGKATTEWHR